MRILAESFLNCPESVSFLTDEENEKGGSSAIRYTWMVSSAFKKLPDKRKLEVLKRFASGSINSTAQANAAISAAPFMEQALQELDKVLLPFFYSVLFAFFARRAARTFFT